MTLGEKITKLRGEHHMSQSDLAEHVHVSRQSVSKWETGASTPDLDKLILLSKLFAVSIDALVKEQESDELNTPQSDLSNRVQEQAITKLSTQKIVGYILLGVGLLGALLSLALGFVLLIPAAYLFFCSIICFTIKKHPGLTIGWLTFLPTAYFLPWFTSAGMKMIFHPHVYAEGWTIQLIVSYSFWFILFLLTFVTAKRTSFKKHPFLFCGWMVFSQIYGFAAIPFLTTENTERYYKILSWLTILFLFVLLFFTGKSLREYLKNRDS